MCELSKIDPNLKIETKINKSDVQFFNVLSTPFRIHGVFHEDGKFRRLPESVARTVSEGVLALHAFCAGGRVRFRTDSPYVAIHTKMPLIRRMSHFTFCSSAGFDLYVGNEYAATYMPPLDMTEGYEGVVELQTSQMREITINFPPYSEVGELFIGLKEGSALLAPTPYRVEKPIVYYGSSVTQGGCASRPGNTYQSFVTNALDVDHINLGFSGNAKGEPEIADYIKGLDMSVFVYDYDYNSPSSKHLQDTHEPMFQKIRESHPDLPIVILSRPRYHLSPAEEQRLEIIRTTYKNALAKGDRNVYLIEGKELMALAKNNGTVDGCHPNDLGFFSMAEALIKVLKNII